MMFAVQAGAIALENGHTSFIGFGGQTLAILDLAKVIMCVGTKVSGKICIMCTKCVEQMHSMMPSSCVVRDKAHTKLYQKCIKNNSYWRNGYEIQY